MPVTVLERRPEQENNLTRAFAVHARTMELLDARGLAESCVARGARSGGAVPASAPVDLASLRVRFPFLLLITPQYRGRAGARGARAPSTGARILRGVTVEGLRQDERGVERHHRRGHHRAGYVVGTDGVHSAVRQSLGLPFPGRTVARSVMLADVRLAQAPPDVVTANADGEAFGFVAPFGDGWYRVIAWHRDGQLPDDAPWSSRRSGRRSPARARHRLRHARRTLDCPGSTATSGRCPATGSGGCSSPATPHTSTAPPAARA